MPRIRVIGATCAALVAGSLFATAAQAAPTYYNNEATFLAANNGLALESFETLPNTPFGPNVVTSNFNIVGTTQLMVRDTPITGLHATDGVKFVVASQQGSITFSGFANPVTAFGLTITDFGDFAQGGGIPSGSLTYTDSNGNATTIALAPLLDATETFFGITDTVGITSLTIASDSVADTWAFDEVYFGAAGSNPGGGPGGVPLPAAVWMGLAVGVIGVAKRLRVGDRPVVC